MEHEFTNIIKSILATHFSEQSETIFQMSDLIKYLNFKTKSSNKDSKARGSFANLYVIYTLVEDYLNRKFDVEGNYSKYEGAKFTDLFIRQRELPFGAKLQNHAFNNRLTSEFKKICPTCEYELIVRDINLGRYWINENSLIIYINDKQYNIAKPVIEIIQRYIKKKQEAFISFLATCEHIKSMSSSSLKESFDFIFSLLEPNVDARIFEIVSFSILKYFYKDTILFYGFNKKE